MIPNAWMSWDAMVLVSSCLSSGSETKNKGQNPNPKSQPQAINSRSKFDPLLNNTSRYPVAEVIQIRSLDGTVHKKSLAEQIDLQEEQAKRIPAIESSVTLGLPEDTVA